MSGKSKKRRPRSSSARPSVAEPVIQERAPRRAGLFGGSMVSAGDSALPTLGRSLGRGFLVVLTQPVLVVLAVVLVAATWLLLVALGFEGAPGRLSDTLAMPPISTYFDLGTGVSLFGLGTAFLDLPRCGDRGPGGVIGRPRGADRRVDRGRPDEPIRRIDRTPGGPDPAGRPARIDLVHLHRTSGAPGARPGHRVPRIGRRPRRRSVLPRVRTRRRPSARAAASSRACEGRAGLRCSPAAVI